MVVEEICGLRRDRRNGLEAALHERDLLGGHAFAPQCKLGRESATGDSFAQAAAEFSFVTQWLPPARRRSASAIVRQTISLAERMSRTRATASPAMTGAISKLPVWQAPANSAMTSSRRISSSSRPSHRCVCLLAKHRPVKGCGHTLFARDIEDDATHRFVSGSGHDALLCRIPAG